MSKLHKILIGVFCMGVLLCGMGAGVAFTEFSELTYGEKQFLGKTDMRTENFDVEYEPGEKPQDIIGWYRWERYEVLTDNNIPVNTVRFCVTYNASRIVPYAYWDEENGDIALVCHWKVKDSDDDIALMMEAKDLILQNLKEGKVVSLDVLDLEEVTVLVNPVNEEDVRLVY